eukprot:1767442-Rhodomonas_salina.2
MFMCTVWTRIVGAIRVQFQVGPGLWVQYVYSLDQDCDYLALIVPRMHPLSAISIAHFRLSPSSKRFCASSRSNFSRMLPNISLAWPNISLERRDISLEGPNISLERPNISRELPNGATTWEARPDPRKGSRDPFPQPAAPRQRTQDPADVKSRIPQ